MQGFVLALALLASSCNSDSPTHPSDGPGSGSAMCALQHASCTDRPCCSGICSSGTCACTESGGNCMQGMQCCSGVCAADGICAPCNPAGSLCQTPANCCSGICTGGVCEAPPDAAASCGQPGYMGNSIGVGKYCTTLNDCPSTAPFCATLGSADAHFCTTMCTSTTDTACGDNAACECPTGGCGCHPSGC